MDLSHLGQLMETYHSKMRGSHPAPTNNSSILYFNVGKTMYDKLLSIKENDRFEYHLLDRSSNCILDIKCI